MAQGASLPYAGVVLGTQGLEGYWRLGEASGSAAADRGRARRGELPRRLGLGARGALSADADAAVRFDGVDDELQGGDDSLALTGAGTLEGWFFWEAGVAVLRDSHHVGGLDPRL